MLEGGREKWGREVRSWTRLTRLDRRGQGSIEARTGERSCLILLSLSHPCPDVDEISKNGSHFVSLT